MAELQLGGKTIATQTGNQEPIFASNVNLVSATFPAGHVIQFQKVTSTTEYLTGNNTTALALRILVSPCFDKNRDLKSSEITDVFMRALSNRFPDSIRKPEFSLRGFAVGNITS